MLSSKIPIRSAKVSILTSLVILSFIISSTNWNFENGVHSDSVKVSTAAILLLFIYVLIIFELVDRSMAALIGAAMSIAAYDYFVKYVSMEELIGWQDLETLSLLFGMMLISNIISISGLFDYLALLSYEKANGRFWLLIVILSFVTATVSAFIDNVSTMLLLSPTLIKLAQLEGVDPRYIIMIMTIFSNIGGCATPIGDPPNLIVIGDKLVSSDLNISFGKFVLYCTPCVLLITILCLIYIKLVYKTKENFKSRNNLMQQEEDNLRSTNEAELLKELQLLQSFDEQFEKLNIKLTSESLQLRCKIRSRKHSIENNVNSTAQLTPKKSLIRTKSILIKSVIVITFAVALFFSQSLFETKMTLGWISLFSGLTLTVLCSNSKVPNDEEGKESEESVFELAIARIEWQTLIFFFALFIVMEVMTKMGLILFLGTKISQLIDLLPSGNLRSIGAITLVLWFCGISSAFIDNIPITSMMIKILGSLLTRKRQVSDLNMVSLVFALVFGSCLGGNGTLIGATANLVSAGICARHGYPISFKRFFKFAAPITILTLIISNIYLVLVFVVFGG